MQQLFTHQKEGIEFLKKSKRAILADEMGLGKTRQAIMASGETAKGTIVVCPASLKVNWMREIMAVYPEDEIEILNTSEDPGNARGTAWFIINYDILEKKMEYLLWLVSEGIVDTMILDEAHYIKGKSIRATCVVGGRLKKGQMTYEFDGLANKMKQVFALTGTPLLNRPIEMFNLLRAIGHELGQKRTLFSTRYCGGYLRTIYRRNGGVLRIWDESGATNLDELRRMIKGSMLRRKKKDVLDLPDKIISVMDVDLSKEWKKTYKEAWDQYIEFLQANPIPEKNIDNIIMARQLVEIQKLKQVCSKAKVDRMVADIENAIEQGEKVIVFSQYTETIRMIADKVREIKMAHQERKGEMITVKCATLTGADNQSERQKAVDDFQNDWRTMVFVGNIKAAGVGLTLTEASIVMFADMDWSPETHSQAEDRAHRIGQNSMVNVYYYIASGTIEEDIIDALNLKKGVMNQILEGNKNRLKKQASIEDVFLRKVAGRVTNRL